MQATNRFVAEGLPACFQLPILILTNATARPAVPATAALCLP